GLHRPARLQGQCDLTSQVIQPMETSAHLTITSIRRSTASIQRPLLLRRICRRVRSRLWIAAGPRLLATAGEILISVSRGFSPPPETQCLQASRFLADARITCWSPGLVYL